MRRFLCIVLISGISSFLGCKEDKESSKEGMSQQDARTEEAEVSDRKKKTRDGPSLMIFKDNKLVARIPPEEFAGLTTASVEVEGKQYEAILLSDLLRKYNVTGKTVILSGAAKTAFLSWEQIRQNAIYAYVFQDRLHLYHTSKALQTASLPKVLVKITVARE